MNSRLRQVSRSPLGTAQKRAISSHAGRPVMQQSALQQGSPLAKQSNKNVSSKFWSQAKGEGSPSKRPVSLSRPTAEQRSTARSVRREERSSSDFVREEIEISPDLTSPVKPRSLFQTKLQLVNRRLLQECAGSLPNFEPSKHSREGNGLVEAYSATTNQGTVRGYNEDRVAIILNMKRPEGVREDRWKKCSYFGVYDGHGGTTVADFLRDNLHHFIVKDQLFPEKPLESIKAGFSRAEQLILEQAQRQPNGQLEKSGSCAISLLIQGRVCYVANVGDSRAVMSCNEGTLLYELSIDHKPTDNYEQRRVASAGGRIYQTRVQSPGPGGQRVMTGPYRVLPGRLSVTRTFGDAEAKLPKYGGNPGVVIAKPEIKYFEVGPEVDFIVLCSDGVFDKASSEDIVAVVWETLLADRARLPDLHALCGLAVENILKFAAGRKSTDNLTAVLVAFAGLRAKFERMAAESPKRKEEAGSAARPPTFADKRKANSLHESLVQSVRGKTRK